MDSYEKCAGDALRACTIREEGLMNQGTSDNFLSAITNYIKCFKEQGKSCNAAILHHMITIYKVYKKHLGEKKGEFGKMEFARCIINTDPAEYALPVPNIVHFLVAYEWQHLYIAKKAGLCDNMPTKGLKRIAVNSGIIRKEHLENVENDEFAKCVGDAMRKCMMRAEYLMKKGISQDFLAAMTDYITCYEKEGYNCDKKMMRDYVNIMKAYRKHLEEKHGEYGKMVNKIELIKTYLSNMFSAIFIVFAMGLVSVESSTVQSAFEVAMRCTKKAWQADVDALASGPVTEEEILEDACIYLREFARCIVNTDPSKYASPNPNIVHLLAAYEWQHLYIAEMAGICANMP
ncbi:unnamed protein product, partial [Porites lobata]